MTRPVLTGVHFSKVKHNGGWAIKLVATDGYKLTEKVVEVDFEPAFEDMIVPASTLEMVSKLLGRTRKVMISDSQFKIMNTKHDPEGVLERTVTIGATIEGEFPDYKKAMPSGEADTAVVVNVKYLLEALKQCDTNTVVVELRGNTSPLMLKDGEDATKVVSAVMPLKP
jgi:DNA polymerase III sliding clamp (beta) subunit (PCNA family)